MTDKPVSVDHTPEGEGVTLGTKEHQDQAAAAINGAWSMMLAQMTDQGATRKDIVAVTVQTAHAVIMTTHTNLWPNAEVPPGEEENARALRDVLGLLDTIPSET